MMLFKTRFTKDDCLDRHVSSSTNFLEGTAVTASMLHDFLVKKPLRESAVPLPFSENVQHWYYDHSGDFCDGWAGAFATNMTLTALTNSLYGRSLEWSERNPVRKLISSAYDNPMSNTYLGALAATTIVCIEETLGIFSQPSLDDIPAGLLGVLTHIMCRYITIKNVRKNYDNSLNT